MRAILCAIVLSGFVVPLRADDTAGKAVLERAIQALGGEKNLAGARAVVLKVKGSVEVNDQKIEVAGEWSLVGVDRFRWEAEAMVQGRMDRSTVGGAKGKAWLVANNGRAIDLPGEFGKGVQANIRCLRLVQNPLALRDKAVTLAPLGELKIDDREAVGLKVSQKGQPDLDLFFDKKSGVPVKAVLRLKETKDGQDVEHSFRFDGYKAAGGIKHFTKVRWLREDKVHLALEVSEVRPQEKLDDTLFTKPQP